LTYVLKCNKISSSYFYNSMFLFPCRAISRDIAYCTSPGLRGILVTTMCFN